MLEELPAAIDYVKTLPKVCSTNTTEGWYSEVSKRLIASYGNQEYYLRIKQSNVFGDYYICLYRRNLNVHPVVESDFQFTLPAARALLSRLPVALNAADDEQCWAKEPKTNPLERMTTDMVWNVSVNRFYGNAIMTSHVCSLTAVKMAI